ncbi:beta-galactosidase [Leptospira broomii serovar Hurstbridge str. 5399]|uniref:Beta-galactosidase n=1 Tax=Leptospira broomii serovar Hurstbridge str. 5399 TaxID=1049789 RepID=T0F8V9_9LEPT|nr:beta-galactosidase [Leptospira broomii]EQA43952.1 beta-galactosidase [Leptospira broomii serovar Hurstbridge str. 5399]
MRFGADYYPEQWTPKDWEEDLRIMKDMGLSIVRLAEFSWGMIEPKEGKFDFSFWERILDLVGKFDMKVILGTPTATFPPWLARKYPDVMQVRDGIQRTIGTRRQACFSSLNYRNAVIRVVTKMAQSLGTHPTVIAWQIDNEIGHEGSDIDHSDTSLRAFRLWLKNKYKTIKNLNETWGNIFWGVLYGDWNEISIPGSHISANYHPSMIQDFYRFHSDTIVAFVKLQAKILRTHSPERKLTTNLYPSPFLPIIDMSELFEDLDYVSWDNYPTWGEQEEPFPHPFISAMHQYNRGLKNKSFTVMEQISGFQGHDVLGYLPAPGQTKLWMKQAIAQGAEQIVFFRYRTARYGQEQLCYGILDHDKSLTERYFELQTGILEILPEASDFASESFPAEVAVLHDIDNARNFKHQPVSAGLKFSPVPFAQVGYDVEMATWFAGLNILNVNTHFLPANKTDFFKYKVIILPLYSMIDDQVVDNLRDYVKNGGTLVLGYRAGIKNKNGWMLDSQAPGPFQAMAGIRVRKFEAVGNQRVKFRFRILPGTCSKICEIIELDTAEVWAKYTAGNKFYTGMPVITCNRFGKGSVIYIGASLHPTSFMLVYRRILRRAGVPFTFYGPNVEKVFRKGKTKDYEILMNHSRKRSFAGLKLLKPFEVRIFPRNKT